MDFGFSILLIVNFTLEDFRYRLFRTESPDIGGGAILSFSFDQFRLRIGISHFSSKLELWSW